jgi:hypothetical protein
MRHSSSNPSKSPRLILATLVCVLWLSASIRVEAAGEWTLFRRNGHDYVSLDNIASFYGLAPASIMVPPPAAPEEVMTPVNNRAGFSNGEAEIGIRTGSREIIINGVRQWLSFPVTEEDGKLLISRIDLAKTIEPMLRPQRIADLKRVETVIMAGMTGGPPTSWGRRRTTPSTSAVVSNPSSKLMACRSS